MKIPRAMKKNKHIGSNFDDFLREEKMLEEIEEIVTKRIFVFQMQKRRNLKSQTDSK